MWRFWPNPPLLLLHGTGVTLEHWKGIKTRLSLWSWSNSNDVFSQKLHVVNLVSQEIFSWDDCTVLYHIILYCTVLNCIVQYSIILYITLLCTVFYCNVLGSIVIHWCAGLYMVLQLEQRYNTLQFSVIQYNTVQYNTIQYSTVQYSTIQYNAVKYNTIQFSTVQYSTIQ